MARCRLDRSSNPQETAASTTLHAERRTRRRRRFGETSDIRRAIFMWIVIVQGMISSQKMLEAAFLPPGHANPANSKLHKNDDRWSFSSISPVLSGAACKTVRAKVSYHGQV